MLVIFTFFMIDIFLVMYSDLRTTNNSFIEEKSSKIKHFTLNKKLNRDIVFIGSSRTIFHISTKIFKDYDLDIYNFGVSGNFLVDYPTYVKRAIEQKPKNIVISIPINTLYNDITEVKNPFLEDIFFYKHISNKQLFYNSLYYWLKNRHIFLSYSSAIVVKFKLFYDSFEPENKKKVVIHEISKVKSKAEQYDCKVFRRQKINKNKIILKCINGDGILLGSNINKKSEYKENLKNINKKTFKILKELVKIISENKIHPIIVFEPIAHNHYLYESRHVKEWMQNIHYIDLTNFRIEDFFWADNGHLNIEGRKIYSDYLAKYLKNKLR